jgi:16S rRNA (cytosine967-C5)-methyltransferase
MAISPARTIAYETLRRVEAEGAYASDVLHAELPASVKAEDTALATELTLGVLRWRRLLDFLLDRSLKKPVAKLDLPVAIALRIGLYQLRHLDRVPASAAVNESVELVKRARKASAATLVNAVLRRAASESGGLIEKLFPQDLSPAERLAILQSHPTWMVERWLARLGPSNTEGLLKANNRTPHLSCAINDVDRREAITSSLAKAGLRVTPGQLLKNAIAVTGGSPARTDAFRHGWISIQDEASQIVPLLLDVHPGDRALDVCAAPGGKTPTLVRATGRAGVVVAADRHAHRLRAMRAHFERVGLRDVAIVELDATKSLPFGAKFDRILVDAPCSGTGTLARHPEIRWRLRPEQLAEFHALQAGMLMMALAALARGGRLVYSTCSIEPEENDEVVAKALAASRSVRRVTAGEMARALTKHLVPGVEAEGLFDRLGQFKTLPGAQDCDGFFAAAIEKE